METAGHRDYRKHHNRGYANTNRNPAFLAFLRVDSGIAGAGREHAGCAEMMLSHPELN